MRGKYTSGERRGAIILGIVALSVAALAVWRGSIAQMPATPAPVHVEKAVDPDTAKTNGKKATAKSASHKRTRKSGHKTVAPAIPRSPLDEQINQADK